MCLCAGERLRGSAKKALSANQRFFIFHPLLSPRSQAPPAAKLQPELLYDALRHHVGHLQRLVLYRIVLGDAVGVSAVQLLHRFVLRHPQVFKQHRLPLRLVPVRVGAREECGNVGGVGIPLPARLPGGCGVSGLGRVHQLRRDLKVRRKQVLERLGCLRAVEGGKYRREVRRVAQQPPCHFVYVRIGKRRADDERSRPQHMICPEPPERIHDLKLPKGDAVRRPGWPVLHIHKILPPTWVGILYVVTGFSVLKVMILFSEGVY